jgi:hypothetical protein
MVRKVLWLRRGYRIGMTLAGLAVVEFDPVDGLYGMALPI